MRFSEGNDAWVMGFEDETRWSRVALPSLHGFREEGQPLRLVQQSVGKDDPDPKAISCYGLPARAKAGMVSLRGWPPRKRDNHPIPSACSEKRFALGKRALGLVWDNASWHISREVRRWISKHNREGKNSDRGLRIISCLLPKQSPWFNPIEAKWVHGKRRVVEVDRLLTAHELAEWVCKAFDCPHHEHLSVPERVI